jgi:hypothetical protein
MRIAWDQYALDARYTPEGRVPEFATRNDTYVESYSGKRAKESGVRDRRYSIRYPFAAGAEMLELESGTRVTGVTSRLQCNTAGLDRKPLQLALKLPSHPEVCAK